MGFVLGMLGGILLLAVAADSFITVFSNRGGGWATNFCTRLIWRGLLWIHKRREIHVILALAGPALLLAIILLWYVFLVIGWTMVFAGWDNSVINSSDKVVTDWHQKMAFVGVTLSTLGYGNHIPNGLPWTAFANLTALSGTILLTSSLSYLLAVLSAGLERRQLATQIHTVGTTVPAFIDRAWVGQHAQKLNSYLLDIAAQIDKHAHKHVSFPILRFFHSANYRSSPSRAVLLFSDAVFLVSHGVVEHARPPLPVLHVCEQSIANYLEQAGTGLSSEGLESADEESDSTPPSHLSPELLSRLGLETVDQAQFLDQWRRYRPRREQLVALCNEDGWKDIRFETTQQADDRQDKADCES